MDALQFHYTNHGTESLVILGGGLDTAIPGTHPRFQEIYAYLTDPNSTPDPQHVRALLDVAGQVASRIQPLSERVGFDGRSLTFDGDPIHTTLSRHIVRMLKDGDHGYAGFVQFLENLAENPSKLSRMHLFSWLRDRDFTITPEGYFIGYKGVSDDGRNASVHAGTAVVNGLRHDGRIPNPVGGVVEMPRSAVNMDRDNGCSTGLHVGTWSYARTFAPRTLTVAVNPRDVVAVPRDCEFQKLRTCRYVVMDVTTAPVTTSSYAPDGDAELFPEDDGFEHDQFEIADW